MIDFNVQAKKVKAGAERLKFLDIVIGRLYSTIVEYL